MTQERKYTTIRITVENMRRLKAMAARGRRPVLQQLALLIDEAEANPGALTPPAARPIDEPRAEGKAKGLPYRALGEIDLAAEKLRSAQRKLDMLLAKEIDGTQVFLALSMKEIAEALLHLSDARKIGRTE